MVITKIELDKEDIREIVAEKFDVLPESVHVFVEARSVGYGMGEHTENIPVCYIEK